MLSAFRASRLGFRFGLAPGAWGFHWACLFFGLDEWACAPIFQTLSIIIDKNKENILVFGKLKNYVYYLTSKSMIIQTLDYNIGREKKIAMIIIFHI